MFACLEQKRLQKGFLSADEFSDNAANLICKELGFQHAVDWIDFLDKDANSFSYIVLSSLHCGDTVEKFDNCLFNVSSKFSSELPFMILSCNPKPGEFSICLVVHVSFQTFYLTYHQFFSFLYVLLIPKSTV